MKYLIEPKYPDPRIEVAFTKARVDSHFILIGAIEKNDVNELTILFTKAAHEVIKLLGKAYQIPAQYMQRHLQQFPEKYQLDEFMKENILAFVKGCLQKNDQNKAIVWEINKIL